MCTVEPSDDIPTQPALGPSVRPPSQQEQRTVGRPCDRMRSVEMPQHYGAARIRRIDRHDLLTGPYGDPSLGLRERTRGRDVLLVEERRYLLDHLDRGRLRVRRRVWGLGRRLDRPERSDQADEAHERDDDREHTGRDAPVALPPTAEEDQPLERSLRRLEAFGSALEALLIDHDRSSA
jgi:hypothetical protein